jgi:hypothetical protein
VQFGFAMSDLGCVGGQASKNSSSR